ncbi:hypothetical protein C8R32_12710 [Nitrosospira sp. Nsp5]|uniref:Uncharacterized protein n=1 Tax=Nitrosospira multiformis TaxID=1231 RepID=A0ABY0TBD1_9PROT|nr:hypothetical protein C8R32_12710 [Nitrosospira sp. Nsp5]SDQ57374.1 hypothetical protein SAMN05216402_1380 [Nitrosospira multiformis]
MQLFQVRQRGKWSFFTRCIPATGRDDRAFTLSMTRRNRQTQDYFILNQRQNIHVGSRQNNINRFVFIDTGKFAFITCQQ